MSFFGMPGHWGHRALGKSRTTHSICTEHAFAYKHATRLYENTHVEEAKHEISYVPVISFVHTVDPVNVFPRSCIHTVQKVD